MESLIHIQRLANREPLHSRAVVARQDTRARQAQSGRHSVTASSYYFSSLTLAGWNIRNLGVHSDINSAPRKSAIIDCELFRLRVDIAAISETWLLGSGSVRERNYTIFWCGYPDDHHPMHAVGFAVRNTLLSTVSQPTACFPSLMSLRMSHSAGFLTLLSAYAPNLDASPEDKDAFYAHVSEVIHSVLLGDFNARVGGDVIAWRLVLGHFGIGNINDNGQRLLELCAAHGLCLPGSFSSGPIRSKVTWMHPRSKHWHQLDHIIVRRRQLNAVKR